MQTKHSLTIKNKGIMKFKVTKKEKELYEKLDKVCGEFENAQGTVLSFFALGEDFGGNIFCGDAWKLQAGFYDILKKGLRKDAEEHAYDLAVALLGGISALVREHSIEAKALTKCLTFIYENHDKDMWDEDDEEVELEVTDKNEEPKEEKKETLEALAAKLDKMGYYVSKKPQKKDNTKKK